MRRPELVLDREATDKIYQVILKEQVPPCVAERFIAASRALSEQLPEEERVACARILYSGVDLEAVEVAARLTRRLPLLCANFRLAAAIAECEPSLQSHFINARDIRIRAWLECGLGVLITSVKLVKGLWYLRAFKRGGMHV